MAFVKVDKSELVRAICAALAEKERLTTQQADAAHRAATHEESVPENDKDTRALESSYLAGAQAARARELKGIQNALAFVPLRDFKPDDEIGLTALVTVSGAVSGATSAARGAKQTAYFLMPHGGGIKVRMGADEITVVTPEAMLGQALVGLCIGDTLTVGGRDYEVIDLA